MGNSPGCEDTKTEGGADTGGASRMRRRRGQLIGVVKHQVELTDGGFFTGGESSLRLGAFGTISIVSAFVLVVGD